MKGKGVYKSFRTPAGPASRTTEKIEERNTKEITEQSPVTGSSFIHILHLHRPGYSSREEGCTKMTMYTVKYFTRICKSKPFKGL
jgi:hypothetical protein